MIKNAIVYLATPGFKFDSELLSRNPARPCSAFEQRTAGFCEPVKGSGLVHAVAGHQVICWETEDKILPGSVVSDQLAERIEKIETEQDRKVGRKEARDLKDRIVEELLPKAFVQHRRTHAVLSGRYFIINTSSVARADDLMLTLSRALDSLPFKMVSTNIAPMSAMTQMVAEGESPDGFTIDDTLELVAASETAAKIRYAHHRVDGPEVSSHIASGKVAVKLGMTWNDRVSFVLDEKMHIKRISLLDIVMEDRADPETADEVFDADMALSVGEVTKLLDDLIGALGGLTKPEDDLLMAA